MAPGVDRRAELQPPDDVGPDLVGPAGHQVTIGLPGLGDEQDPGRRGGLVPPGQRRSRSPPTPTAARARRWRRRSTGRPPPAVAPPGPGRLGDGEARLQKLHAEHEPGHVAGHGAHGVEVGRQRPHPVEGDTAPRGLEARPCHNTRTGSAPTHPCHCRRRRRPRRWPPPRLTRSTSPRGPGGGRGGSPVSRTRGSRPVTPSANSWRFVRPTIRAPAALAPARQAASAVAGTASLATARHPAVVGTPSR